MYALKSFLETVGRSDKTIGVAGFPLVAPVFGPVVDLSGLRLLKPVDTAAAVGLLLGFETMLEILVYAAQLQQLVLHCMMRPSRRTNSC